MKQKALKECDQFTSKYAACAVGRTISVVWQCRKQARELNQCLHQYFVSFGITFGLFSNLWKSGIVGECAPPFTHDSALSLPFPSKSDLPRVSRSPFCVRQLGGTLDWLSDLSRRRSTRVCSAGVLATVGGEFFTGLCDGCLLLLPICLGLFLVVVDGYLIYSGGSWLFLSVWVGRLGLELTLPHFPTMSRLLSVCPASGCAEVSVISGWLCTRLVVFVGLGMSVVSVIGVRVCYWECFGAWVSVFARPLAVVSGAPVL
ncbi:cytochrome c oxidase biogenesis protein Cmc1-like [Striga asiatica]|uniref:Cytochrome c oxidase biogenesis protein Cmc1-like n=1 Tax=Striga asiatica TaxID=4170 RepID=A0A5A7QFE7_STRAF|nr:cytochrome c oxidase biogenesis protein Cmc1-like [Striga asiatica]